MTVTKIVVTINYFLFIITIASLSIPLFFVSSFVPSQQLQSQRQRQRQLQLQHEHQYWGCVPSSSISSSTTIRMSSSTSEVEKTTDIITTETSATSTPVVPPPTQPTSAIPTEWKGEVLRALSSIIDPSLGRDIVSLGLVRNLSLVKEDEENILRQISFNVVRPPVAIIAADDSSNSENVVHDDPEIISNRLAERCRYVIDALPWTTNGASIITVTIALPPSPSSLTDITAAATADDATTITKQIADANAMSLAGVPLGLSSVKSIIAVSSCKGGVGKSTTAVNLAYSLSEKCNASVGIFDADVYGPSLPTMVTPDNDDVIFVGRQISPLQRNGVKLMSFGYVNEGSAVMRGPMVTQLLDQFLSLTYWGEIDYLILDMPPGTGDIQLTLSQKLNITAAIIVTTPQELSFVDVERGIEMFDSVNVPCIAVVENMAYLDLGLLKNADNDSLPLLQEKERKENDEKDDANLLDETQKTISAKLGECGGLVSGKDASIFSSELAEVILQSEQERRMLRREKEEKRRRKKKQQNEGVDEDGRLHIFGKGHKKRLSQQWGIDHAYSIPLLGEIASNGDGGTPFVLAHPHSKQAETYGELAKAVVKEIEKVKIDVENNRPEVNFDEDLFRLVVSINDEIPSVGTSANENSKQKQMIRKKYDILPADLRRDCKCAGCVEEMSGRQILQPWSISDRVKPLKMTPTGNYALGIDWSDGHASLYPYRQIKALVQDDGKKKEGDDNGGNS